MTSRTNTIAVYVGILATIAVVFGGLDHAGRTDPEGHVPAAYSAAHGVVIPPFRG